MSLSKDIIVSSIKSAPKAALKVVSNLSLTEKILIGAAGVLFFGGGILVECYPTTIKGKIARTDEYKQFLDELDYRISNAQSLEELDFSISNDGESNSLEIDKYYELMNSMASHKTIANIMSDKIGVVSTSLVNFLSSYYETMQQAADSSLESADLIHEEYLRIIKEHPYVVYTLNILGSMIKYDDDGELLSSLVVFAGSISYIHIRYLLADLIAAVISHQGNVDKLKYPFRALELLTTGYDPKRGGFFGFDYTGHAISLICNKISDNKYIVNAAGEKVPVQKELLDAIRPMTGKRYLKFIPRAIYSNKEATLFEALVAPIGVVCGIVPFRLQAYFSLFYPPFSFLVDHLCTRTNNVVSGLIYTSLLPFINISAGIIMAKKNYKGLGLACAIPILAHSISTYIVPRLGPNQSKDNSLVNCYSYDLRARDDRLQNSQLDQEEINQLMAARFKQEQQAAASEGLEDGEETVTIIEKTQARIIEVQEDEGEAKDGDDSDEEIKDQVVVNGDSQDQ